MASALARANITLGDSSGAAHAKQTIVWRSAITVTRLSGRLGDMRVSSEYGCAQSRTLKITAQLDKRLHRVSFAVCFAWTWHPASSAVHPVMFNAFAVGACNRWVARCASTSLCCCSLYMAIFLCAGACSRSIAGINSRSAAAYLSVLDGLMVRFFSPMSSLRWPSGTVIFWLDTARIYHA